MKLDTPVAYFEQRWRGDADPKVYRGPAVEPELRTMDDGSTVLSFSELFRIKVVDVLLVTSDAPKQLVVVSTDGSIVTLRPLTLAAYRRYIKSVVNGAAFTSQGQLEAAMLAAARSA